MERIREMRTEDAGNPRRDSALALCRNGFYLSVILFLYGTLFPFQFDFSVGSLSRAWSVAGLVPYWNVQHWRIHNLPDMMSNIVLTIPLGFFGFLRQGRTGGLQRIGRLFLLGFLLGLLSEIVQLSIVSRISDITDALNNGVGSALGAFLAFLFGTKLLDLLSGKLLDRKQTCFIVLVAILIISMLLPMDPGMDMAQIESKLKQLRQNPWETGRPPEDEWIQMVEFALAGALASSIGRRRPIIFMFLLPFILEPIQVLAQFRSPSVRDLMMNIAGVGSSVMAARVFPKVISPLAGFLLLNSALIAQGLSPYQFVGWNARSHFQWIPFGEYYYQSMGTVLSDAMSGFMSYLLLAALWPRRAAVLWAILLAGGIEAAQILIPARYPGLTDIIIAAVGAYTGYALSASAADSTSSSGEILQGGRKP